VRESDRYRRLIRWYPAKWRERYGEGLAALLEDTYGADPVPLRSRASLARAGMAELARDAGVIGRSTNSNERLRAGSLLVLSGWSFFLVAGAIFAKFSEHWSFATPPAHRTLSSVGDSAVLWAGVAGAILVLAAGVMAIPAFARFVRTEGWVSMRRFAVRDALALGTAAFLTAGLSVWAHRLSSGQRNGGSAAYEILFLLCCLSIVVAIIVVTSSVISITRQLNFSQKTLRFLSIIALGLTLLMTVVVVGTAVWWISEALYAPHFLRNSIGSGILFTSNALPPTLVVAGVLMIVGLFSAVVGSLRVFGAFQNS
jgi:hypothetical protein